MRPYRVRSSTTLGQICGKRRIINMRHYLLLRYICCVLFVCSVWSISTEATAVDITTPTVVSIFPEDGALGVAINSDISAVFSEAMDTTGTITTATFTLMQGVNPVSGTLTYICLLYT